ncbi:MAG: hypothetical protein ACR2HN_06770 [Tepidiformaceae bacterium]
METHDLEAARMDRDTVADAFEELAFRLLRARSAKESRLLVTAMQRLATSQTGEAPGVSAARLRQWFSDFR